MVDLMSVIVVQGVGLIATVATVAAVSRGHEKRIEKLERWMEDLPIRFVPRTEVELILANITKTTEDTKALMQALVYGGGDRDVARKALEPK